jgi:hypothetical protein
VKVSRSVSCCETDRTISEALNITVSCDMMPCSLVHMYERLGRTVAYFFRLQGGGRHEMLYGETRIQVLSVLGSTAPNVCSYWAVASSSVFLILYTVGRTPWTGDQPIARPLPTHGTTQT